MMKFLVSMVIAWATLAPSARADCDKIRAAFGRTFDMPHVGYTINAANSGNINPVKEEVRIIDGGLFLKRNGSEWVRHDFPAKPSATLGIPSFELCIQQSATKKEVHYSAWLLQQGTRIPIDIWISAKTGKLVRTTRSYSATGQTYQARTVQQVFHYEASSATIPKRYVSGVAFTDVWAVDGDLR
jgi:hypothetical protein